MIDCLRRGNGQKHMAGDRLTVLNPFTARPRPQDNPTPHVR
jgi:hypothetical protein